MTALAAERAPAKVNLCLFLGPTRPDGRHELVTVFDAVSLADELEVVGADRDAVVCDGVRGPNLVSAALAGLRAAGWGAPPVRVRIDKRIPVAGGMGGGSADAAALLRLAPRLAPVEAAVLRRIAAGLGADVPSQLCPGPSLGMGAGDVIHTLPSVGPYGVLVLPQRFGLATAEVYREADRLGLPRPAAALAALEASVRAGLAIGRPGYPFSNDLQPAALSLAPAIDEGLRAAAATGADRALVCGSGPTVIGLYLGPDGEARATVAARRVRDRMPHALAAFPERGGDRGATPKD